VFAGDVPSFLRELPGLAREGSVEPPEVARALLLAWEHGADVSEPLTLDPAKAAALLADAVAARGGGL